MLNYRQTSQFCSYLQILLSAGMPLIEALAVVKEVIKGKRREDQIDRIINKINNGAALSEAARELFPSIVIGSFKAAEKAGNLEETLVRLAKFYENKAETREKLINAAIYPAFVLVLSFLAVCALILFVIPSMSGLFADFGNELPAATKIILWISGAFPYLGISFSLALLGFSYFIRKTIKTQPEKIENWMLKLPLIGVLYRQELVIETTGTIGALLNGGIPIIETLEIAGKASASRIMRNLMMTLKTEIENGGKFSRAIYAAGFFPPEAVQMLAVGENSGRLSEMLDKIAFFQNSKRELLVKKITALIEPVLTLGVGLVVAFVALAMFLPMLGMISSLN